MPPTDDIPKPEDPVAPPKASDAGPGADAQDDNDTQGDAGNGVTAKFVEGSTMRHVVTMTATASFGLMAIFVVDFANLFYIAMLGQDILAAAIGYAGTILFFNISLCIGVTIAATALVSRALGAGDREKARRVAGSSLVFMVLFTSLAVLILLPLLDPILTLLGAKGETKRIAEGFLFIVVPSMPLLGVGMCLSGIMRAVGDAKRAMYVTLFGGLASAILDPLLIFGFDMGVTGAAVATLLSRFALIIAGWHGAVRIHNLVAMPRIGDLRLDFRPIAAIALPAVLTNVATPVGNAYMTSAFSAYGDETVAGWAVIGRVIPIAFGAIFALSGAVGPILGQNLGAGQMERVRQTLVDALVFTGIYTLGVWTGLYLLQDAIVDVFSASGEMADLIRFFCTIVAVTWLFNGALYVANAAFNNLGFPTYSTLFNWGRAILGTVPFVYAGSYLGGAEGALLGQGVGGVVFGVGAIVVCFRVVSTLKPKPDLPPPPPVWRAPQPPFSSGKSANMG